MPKCVVYADREGKDTRSSTDCCATSDQRPPIATLRCEIVPGQADYKLTDALPADKGKEVTVSSRLFRSLRLLHNRQLTVLVDTPPAPQGERIFAREKECQRDRQCPESAIIT